MSSLEVIFVCLVLRLLFNFFFFSVLLYPSFHWALRFYYHCLRKPPPPSARRS